MAPQWLADGFDELDASIEVSCEAMPDDAAGIRRSFEVSRTWRALRDAACEVQRLQAIIQAQVSAACRPVGSEARQGFVASGESHARARRALLHLFEVALADFDAARLPLGHLEKAARAVENGHALPGPNGTVLRKIDVSAT